MIPRPHINLHTKLAATLLQLGDVPYEHARLMTAAQLISLYHFDHGIRHSEDGPAVFWNYTPRLIPAHRVKTATIDIPGIAKGKRIRRKEAEHKARMLDIEDCEDRQRRKRKLPSRPFAKGHRPMRGGNSFQRRHAYTVDADRPKG